MPYTLPDYLNVDKGTISDEQLEVYEEAYPYTKYFEIFNYHDYMKESEYGETACEQLGNEMMYEYWKETKTFYKDDVCYTIPIERGNYFEGMDQNIRQFLRA